MFLHEVQGKLMSSYFLSYFIFETTAHILIKFGVRGLLLKLLS
jgi:hypothetical protein